MARPIMFSQVYPSYHPRAGQPTYFVEKIWKFLSEEEAELWSSFNMDKELLLRAPELDVTETLIPKSHTIRAGNRWKENDRFSPRVWNGPPYRSRQTVFAPDLLVKKTWHIQILPSHEVFIDGQFFAFYGSPEMEPLAYHDGLTREDFELWFSRLPFEGQIICWNKDLEY